MSKLTGSTPYPSSSSLDAAPLVKSKRLAGKLASIPFKAERRLAKIFVSESEAGKPKKYRSEKSRAIWRADKGRDDKILKSITDCLRSKQPVRITNSALDTVISGNKSLSRARLSGMRIIPDIGLPHWDHTDPHLKMLAWGMASSEMLAVPFSLHLNDLVVINAQSDKRGVGRHMQDRIGRHLRNRLGDVPPFWFSVEAAMLTKPHLHGAIVIPPGRREEVRAALMAAGGPWKDRQLSFSVKRSPATWVSYATKWFYGTKAHVHDNSTTGATNSVRSAARDWHQSARREERVLYPI